MTRTPGPSPAPRIGPLHIVLAGAGHAAMVALDALGHPPEGTRITLVSRGGATHYSGMVPGWIEGLYREDEMAMPLAPFAERVGVRRVDGEIVGADDRAVKLSCGERVPYDVLVVDTGSVTARPGPLADPRVLAAKPFGGLVDGLRPVLDVAASFAVVGAGVAGIEVSFALATRRPDARVSLLERGDTLLSGLPRGFARTVARHLAAAGVDLRLGADVTAVEADRLRLAGGATVPAECVLALTGPRAPDWLAATPFARAGDGFLAVDGAMRSLSHPNVLAVGDAATRPDDPRPKAGVFAVRSGPHLARALSALGKSEAPQPVTLQREALILIATGNRHALGTRNGLFARGRWVWRLKDRLDRDFVARFAAD